MRGMTEVELRKHWIQGGCECASLRVTIVKEKSVEVIPLLVASLGTAVVSCDSAK